MARPAQAPKLLRDRSGRAFTKIRGRFFSLGKADTPEAHQRFAELLQKHHDGTLFIDDPLPDDKFEGSINELLFRYVDEELPRFSSAEQFCQKSVVRLLGHLFGETRADEFGPNKLRHCRDAMLKGDPAAADEDGEPAPRKPWIRSTVNRQVKRLRAIFRWGASFELFPIAIVQTLETVKSLRPGQQGARESTPRRPATEKQIKAVRKELRQRDRDIFDLLLLTGARPGELIALTPAMFDRTGDVWRVELKEHKTAFKGKRRFLLFNEAAQLILANVPRTEADERLFPIRRDTFGRAVKRACVRAGVTPFVPHQLRHTVATKLADAIGLEAAQRVLGHSSVAMTEHYAREAIAQAIQAIKKLG